MSSQPREVRSRNLRECSASAERIGERGAAAQASLRSRVLSRTKSLIAEERLPCRSLAIEDTISEIVVCLLPAISLSRTQNGSSRLTLVRCPSRTIERLTTSDFISFPPKVVSAHIIERQSR